MHVLVLSSHILSAWASCTLKSLSVYLKGILLKAMLLSPLLTEFLANGMQLMCFPRITDMHEASIWLNVDII